MSIIVSIDRTSSLSSTRAAIRLAAQEGRSSPLVAMTAYSGETLPTAPAARPPGRPARSTPPTTSGPVPSFPLLPGGASRYVLRHAPCPVLVVPDGATRADPRRAGP